MNLLLFTTACLGTFFQTACAAPSRGRSSSAISQALIPALEISPGKALFVSVFFTPGYKANITFSKYKASKPPFDPFRMIFSGLDCPIAFAMPDLAGSDISHRVFTQFTLQDASTPLNDKTGRRRLNLYVKYIPPPKGGDKVTADYEITFHSKTADPPALPYKFIYEKNMPPRIPINYVILENQNRSNKWGYMKSGVFDDSKPEPKPKPIEESGKREEDGNEGDDMRDGEPSAEKPNENGGSSGEGDD